MLTSRQIQFLLEDLCRDLGFCLPPQARIHLIQQPPDDITTFTDAVFRAEGLDPIYADRQLYKQVQDLIAKHWNIDESK